MNNYIDLENGKVRLEMPNRCPFCNVTQIPLFLNHQHEDDRYIVSLWKCTNKECYRIIVADNEKPNSSVTYKFMRYVGGGVKLPNFPAAILELKDGISGAEKTKFIEIYNQSLKAENYGLNEISGMGYRKSLEYLVKDLAVQNKPDSLEKIKGMPLATVIKDFIEGDIKDLLIRAVWLGNDQTHYHKIFEQFDIETIKQLIDVIVADLDREYKKKLYNEAIKPYNKP